MVTTSPVPSTVPSVFAVSSRTVVVDVTTRSASHAKYPKALSGRLRLHYELHTVVFLRKWLIVHIDNVSMKYREEPRPDAGELE